MGSNRQRKYAEGVHQSLSVFSPLMAGSSFVKTLFFYFRCRSNGGRYSQSDHHKEPVPQICSVKRL